MSITQSEIVNLRKDGVGGRIQFIAISLTLEYLWIEVSLRYLSTTVYASYFGYSEYTCTYIFQHFN